EYGRVRASAICPSRCQSRHPHVASDLVGVHQRFARTYFRVEEFEAEVREGENPLARSLGFAMRASQAVSGALIVGLTGEDASDGFVVVDGHFRNFTADRMLAKTLVDGGDAAVLFDIKRERILTRPPEGPFRFLSTSDILNLDEARHLGLSEGVIAEIR